MIKSFLFENFKSFDKAELQLESFATLIGANASGKSNAIEGIKILSLLVTGLDISTILDGNAMYGGAIRGGAKGCLKEGENSFKLGCRIYLDDDRDLVYQVEVGVGTHVWICDEILYCEGKNNGPTYEVFGISAHVSGYNASNEYVLYDIDMTAVLKEYPSSTSALLGVMTSMMAEHKRYFNSLGCIKEAIDNIPNIFFLEPVPEFMRDYMRIDDAELRKDCANLSPVLNKICSSKQSKERVLKLLHSVPENDIVDIGFVDTSLGDILLTLTERYGKQEVLMDARRLSDGTLRYLSILAALLMEKRYGLIVIEELDNGIHAARIKQLVDNIIELSGARKCDVLVTTHSATLLNCLTKEALMGVSIVYRDQETGASRFTSFVDIERFPELLISGGLGNAVAHNDLQNYLGERRNKKPDYARVEGGE